MMTSQGRLYVTDGLYRRNVWVITEIDKLEKISMFVITVRNGFCLRETWSDIWIFTQTTTGVQNVANAAKVPVIWQYTDEVIQERNRLNVLFVANDLHGQVALWSTAEFTVERNRTSVHCVTRVSVTPATCSDINVMYTATVDRQSTRSATWSCEAVCLQWMSKAFLYSSWIETASSSTLRIQTVFLWFVWYTVRT